MVELTPSYIPPPPDDYVPPVEQAVSGQPDDVPKKNSKPWRKKALLGALLATGVLGAAGAANKMTENPSSKKPVAITDVFSNLALGKNKKAPEIKKSPEKPKLPFDILSSAQNARGSLKGIKTGNDVGFIAKGSNKEVQGKLGKSNILLAVIKDGEKEIDYVKIKASGETVSKKYQVKHLSGSGVAARYQVTFEQDGKICRVLGLKRALQIKGQGVKEVVYTPYSEDFDTPELRKVGLDFLGKLIVDGKDDLRAKKVISRAFSGKLAADAISDDLLKALVLIEHVDVGKALKSGTLDRDLVKKAVNEVLTTIALNKDLAYDYSVSPAGARGFFQFMEKTYYDVREQYPGANLDEQAVRGLANEKNGALAQILLTDSDLGFLLKNENKYFADLYQNDQRKLGEFLAASYNAGGPNVLSAFRGGKGDLLKYFKEKGNLETFHYVQKYRFIIDLLKKGELGK